MRNLILHIGPTRKGTNTILVVKKSFKINAKNY